MFCFFFQAEDGIRDLVRSRGLGDVYKRQVGFCVERNSFFIEEIFERFQDRLLQSFPDIGLRARNLSLIHI